MRIEHIEFRIEQQCSVIELIENAHKNLTKIESSRITRIRVSTRIEALKEQWLLFTNNNDAITLATSKLQSEERTKVKECAYFRDNLYSRTYDRYLENLEKMNELLESHQEFDLRPLSSSSVSQTMPQSTICHAPRLPRIDLPKFNGNLADWLPFRDLFVSLVISNQAISAVEKLQYLTSSLQGSAAHLLKNTALTADNFQKSWDALVSFYENKRLLVNSALQSLFSIKKLTNESASDIEYLYTSIMQVYRTLETLNRPIQAWDDILVFMITQRLDSESIKTWENCLGPSKEPPTWEQLRDFLLTRMLSLQAVEKSQAFRQPLNSRPPARSHFTGTNESSKTEPHRNLSCPLCSEKHYIANCSRYQQLTPKQRKETVTQKGCCFNCLGFHQVSKCKSTRRCNRCGKRHHSSLHVQENVFHAPPSSTNFKINGDHASTDHLENKSVNHGAPAQTNEHSIIALATAQVKARNPLGDAVRIRALLDQGSEITLITETLVQRLRLARESTTFPILGIGATTACHTRGIVNVSITPHFDSSKVIALKAHILPKLTASIPSVDSKILEWPHLRNIQLADPQLSNSGKIDLLIGADSYGQLLEGSILKGPVHSPTAQLTTLGWVISGPATESSSTSNRQTLHCSVDHDLCNMLEKFWHQEEIFLKNETTLSISDRQCEDHFRSNHARDSESGKYVVRLPFKASSAELGDSQFSAIRMLEHMHRKFDSSPLFFKAYSDFMEEYERLDHMRKVPANAQDPDESFYLPHHGVIRESSTTTKLRVVFNGSCKLKTGKSINEILHTGEKLQTDLFDVILWFRQFKYIFSSDIEKMYRQIRIHPDDWKFQRILWKTNEKIEKYELTTVTYGLACAPFLALRCVKQLIQDEGRKFPLAVDILSKGRYVDDVFGGADTISEAQVKARQTLDLCMAGGFPLRKWNSNHKSVLNSIPAEYQTTTASVVFHDNIIHALGLSWNTSSDTLQFKLRPLKSTSCTKRTVLSQIAQFFDPLGLLSPIFILAKIFMQELWSLKLGWDDPLPPPQQKSWQELLSMLNHLEDLTIPRWTGTFSTMIIELHGFCDASQLAMAAVVYVRTFNPQNRITVTLVCSKTKVAPIKRVTIPRLELAAAVILTKLTSHCCEVLNLRDAPCYLWTDSAIVNTWLNNHPSRWKDFVHNRVCYIQETLPSAQWRHVPGNCNPADCATRGMSAKSLQAHTLWWHGPSWLIQDSAQWPNNPFPTPDSSIQLEERAKNKSKVSCVTIPSESWSLLNKYSSLNRLLKITALCQRAKKLFRKELTVIPGQFLTPSEIEGAKKYWIKQIQQQDFAAEIKSIKQGENLAKSNPLVRLTPYLDEDNLLRVGGRLENSTLSKTAKHPYILSNTNYFAHLIISQAHEKTLHGSTQETLSYVRNEYWIVGGRAPIRSYIIKCVKCTRFRKANAQQLMGQLPPSRVNPSRAFLNTGVDYAGPFSLKPWKGRTTRTYKAWVALFVCLATSAIHLELVTDYSSDGFIAAYKRFVGRRGICATLTSDCGTNFKGADQELQKLFSATTQEFQQLASLIANDGTKWIFNPPSAPHFGGKWEAGVKSFKYHFRRVAGSSLLTYEEMNTILIQIEAILNSRPLSPLTNDPDDLDVLTPAHFLLGQSLTVIPEPNLEHLQVSRLSRWQHLSQMIQSFWTRWSKEYLQRHHSIYKWNQSADQLSEGTLVFVIDERYPPAKWALGRIMQLHPGKDNLARVATVKTSTNIFKRPIAKLCPLNIEFSTD